jgi:hypothetical protein
MEYEPISTYPQYYTLIVFGQHSFRLPLTPNNMSVLVISSEYYLENMMTYSANILVYSTDI